MLVSVELRASLEEAYTCTSTVRMIRCKLLLNKLSSKSGFLDLALMRDSEVKFPLKCQSKNVIPNPLKPAKLLPKYPNSPPAPSFEPKVPDALRVRRCWDLCKPRGLAP